MAGKRRNVVLHFDLNRTVLMSDAAGGRTMENTVDYLLSECTWGYVHPQKPTEVRACPSISVRDAMRRDVVVFDIDTVDGVCVSSCQWVCVSDASSIEPPTGGVSSVAVDGKDVAVKLITYKQFVDDSHPYQSLQSTSGSTIEQIKAFNKCVVLASGFSSSSVPPKSLCVFFCLFVLLI